MRAAPAPVARGLPALRCSKGDTATLCARITFCSKTRARTLQTIVDVDVATRAGSDPLRRCHLCGFGTDDHPTPGQTSRSRALRRHTDPEALLGEDAGDGVVIDVDAGAHSVSSRYACHVVANSDKCVRLRRLAV